MGRSERPRFWCFCRCLHEATFGSDCCTTRWRRSWLALLEGELTFVAYGGEAFRKLGTVAANRSCQSLLGRTRSSRTSSSLLGSELHEAYREADKYLTLEISWGQDVQAADQWTLSQ